MSHSKEIRQRSLKLRKSGYSLAEISRKLGIPKNTLSGWFSELVLSDGAKRKIAKKARQALLAQAERRKEKTQGILNNYLSLGNQLVDNIRPSRDLNKIFCSLIYWCEGTKDTRAPVCFINSDPDLIKAFVNLLRNSFDIDEKKFRICLHLHAYHNASKQIDFWSKFTGIPKNQFIKPFLKQNNGKIKRSGYQGCASVRYYDTNIARQLLMTARVFLTKYGGMV